MSRIKKNWFTALVFVIVALFMLTVALVLIAPKQDVKMRGFVKCSRTLAEKLENCEGTLWCSAKSVLACSVCDVKVVARGISDWQKGKQPYPWSNYIFIPELPENSFIDEKARTEYLEKYPNTKQEMDNLHKLRKEMEDEQNLQEFDPEMLPQ